MSRNGIFTMMVKETLTMIDSTPRMKDHTKAEMSPCQIKVEWDEEGQVWVASSDDAPGLATGADTFEDLVAKLRLVVPELLEENGLIEPDRP